MAKNGFGRAGRHELTAALKWQKRDKGKGVKQSNGKGSERKAVLLAKAAR